ncbi:MAG TPA: GntR family transcriptional regulator [Candidatus Hydrogenedentes bacterium]|nr:GntR family transcriptional regulator [Candidatus Hydrogenedentota bacterium]
MHIRISLGDGVPIYRQIVNQVKYLVASRQLLPGDDLPPIRLLAQQLLITPNTVVKAYRELEIEGVIHKRRGAGTFVSEAASPLARNTQRKILAERADLLLAEARQMDFTFDEVVKLLEQRQKLLDEGTVEKKHERRQLY